MGNYNMKTVIALLLANASALNIPRDHGYVALSACQTSAVSGISCEEFPDDQFFATGMNGDEDLGEDIQMKGEPFHFNQEPSLVQWGPLDIITPFNRLPICNGNKGPAYVNCKRPKCDGTNGPMDGVASSGCVQEV